MSLAEVKQKVMELPLEDQAELAQFLSEQLRRDDPAYTRLLADLIDNQDPSRWIKWDDLKQKLDGAP